MDTVLVNTQRTFYSDMSTCVQVYTHAPPTCTDKATVETGGTPMTIENESTKCEKMKKRWVSQKRWMSSTTGVRRCPRSQQGPRE